MPDPQNPNPENDVPSFDELDLPGDDLPAAESLDESVPAFEDAALQVDGQSLPEPQEAETEDQPKKKWGRKKKKKEKKTKVKKDKVKKDKVIKDKVKKDKRRPEEGEQEQSEGLLQTLSQASPYTVMLGLALLAIVIAVYCLFKELGRYDFDIKAEKTKPVASSPGNTAPATQFGPPSTSEAA